MRFERTEIQGGFILADAALAPVGEWFEPGYWRRRGAGAALGRGRGVAVSAGSEAQWVLRHYRRGGLPGRFIADAYVWLGAARARPVRELRLLGELIERGAPVVLPVAARVVRRGTVYRGDILIGRIAGACTLADCALGLDGETWAWIGTAIRRFHDAGGWHADLNAHNLLLSAGGVVIADLDRGRLVSSGAAAQRRNLARLRRSLLKLGLLPATEFGWRSLVSAYCQR